MSCKSPGFGLFLVKDSRLPLFAGAIGALGLWLGFANNFLTVPPLVLFWPIALSFLGLSAASAKKAFCRGWLVSACGACATLYWLSLPVHHVGGLPWIAAIACAILIAAILATQGAFFCLGAYWYRDAPRLALLIFLALSWYLLEFGYAVALGFPWLPLAGALAAWPLLMQVADLVGAYLGGAIWLCACLAFLLGLPGFPGKKAAPGYTVSGLAMILALCAYGFHSLARVPYERDPGGADAMSAIFVEGNVEQNQKWLPGFQLATLRLYLDLTKAGLNKAKTEGIERPLVIWPETALPFFFEKRPELAAEVERFCRESGCPLLFGAPGLARDSLADGVYNRAFLLDPEGRLLGYYDKEHLVPFGEYLPEWLNFAFLGSLLQGVGIYREGGDPRPLVHGPLALGMLICYEGIFPWLAQERVATGANILVDISNDGWFQDSPAGRQHLYLTVPRSIEQNRWLLRSTNTGISAVVDTRGRLVLEGPQNRAGYLIAHGRLVEKKSVYHFLAPWLPTGALAAMVFLVCWRIRRVKINPGN